MRTILFASVALAVAATAGGAAGMGGLQVSANHRYLQTADGEPFFWQGDTGWLLFAKLNREEAERYLEDRRRKGFNVIQAMVLHTLAVRNAYGSPALIGGDPARPNLAADAHSYWNHADWIIDRAAEKGIYIGMVLVWGSNVRNGGVNASNVRAYTKFLAGRYGGKPNIVWITGGDTRGDQQTEVWRTMGRTLREVDPNHLITFHPFGRTDSSEWFHAEPWLDFNMFQSGHRRYDQDDTPNAKGEDNWRFVVEDYARTPAKPTLDGEPSYEGIPQGLHDPKEPYWSAADTRRYAYWSVFAGACGHTYGHNAVMQMHKPDSGEGAYGVKSYWYDAIDAPGAGQVEHLKNLMLSRPYFERVPAPSLVVSGSGARYDYVAATRGESYAFFYSYTGKPFGVATGKLSGARLRAWWYDPRTGAARELGEYENDGGTLRFDPPGEPAAGNDWVLVLDDAARNFAPPGRSKEASVRSLPRLGR